MSARYHKIYGVWAAVLAAVLGTGCVVLPEVQVVDNVTSLPQGWTEADAEQFWSESQGTVMLPYDWFMALQTPEIKFFGSVDYFADRNYLSRYGFLYGDAPNGVSPTQSPLSTCVASNAAAVAAGGEADLHCGLPLGLARADIMMKEIDSAQSQAVVGFTCAACHTGELHFLDATPGERTRSRTAVRVEGATNLVDVTQFQSALGGALLLTQKLPFRFNRFAANVLDARGYDEDDDARAYNEAKRRLKAQLDSFLAASSPETLTATRLDLYADHPGGFGRTDALARITNMVFGTEMGIDANLIVGSAPVKYPSIWDAPYFAWAQYNGSIEQSMTRNVGEALGTRARLEYVDDMSGGDPGDGQIVSGEMWAGERVRRLESSVDIPGLYAIETLLRGTGKGYFNGLQSPVWPRGGISWSEARAGQELYDDHCAACHLPPIDSLVRWGDVRNAHGDMERGLVPRGNRVYQVEGDSTSPVIGLADDRTGQMYWISNNHPDMLGNLRAGPYKDPEELEYFLNISDVNLGTIGTDPGQAANFAKNIINTEDILLPPFPVFGFPMRPLRPEEMADFGDAPAILTPQTEWPARIMPAGVGLQHVTIKLTTQFYDEVDAQTPTQRQEFINELPRNLKKLDDAGEPIIDQQGNAQAADGLFVGDPLTGTINRNDWDGNRPPGAEVGAHYRPHPLNGIWASPPYLHNGSVPNIYQLLSPYEERDKVFYTGNRLYDVDHLGYVSERFRGGFRYDTSVAGNSNYGHLFQGGGPGNGVIGPELEPQQRLRIMEYLKTLCPPGYISDLDREVLCERLPDTGGRP